MQITAGTPALVQTLVTAAVAYAGVVVLLRLSGKRTLSKWNSFDFIVTIALGSILATVIVSKQVTAAEGVVAFAALVAFQYAVTWLSVRWRPLQRLFKATPVFLVYRGRYVEAALHRERVPESEVRGALRENGIAAVESAGAVVLETDGSLSVIADLGDVPPTALADVELLGGEAERERRDGGRPRG